MSDSSALSPGHPAPCYQQTNLCATSKKRAQACEALYRWDSSFPLGKPLAKLSAGTVVHKLRSYARIHSLYDHTTFCSAVTSISFHPQTDRLAPLWRRCRMQSPTSEKLSIAGRRPLCCRYLATVQDNNGAQTHTVSAEYVMAAGGLLDRQCTAQERSLPALSEYRGHYTLAGRADGRDSRVGDSNLACKVQCSAFTSLGVALCHPARRDDVAARQEVVIIGSGAFACEAMEAAANAGARKITLVTRERKR